AMDQSAVEGTKAAGIDGQPLGNTGTKTLDGDIGGLCQLVHQRPSVLRFHIDRDAPLVAVGAQKHRAESRCWKRRPSPRLIPLPPRFDLDHLRAEIAQILRAERAGENL